MAEKIMLSTQELDELEKTVFSTQELDELDNKVKAAPLRMDAEEPAPWDIDTFIKKISPVVAAARETETSGTAGKDVSVAMDGFIKPWQNLGYSSAAALNRGMAHFSTSLDVMADYIADKTGTEKGGIFESAAKTYEQNTEYWQKKAEENGIAFMTELMGEAVGGAVPGISEFVLNVPYAALHGAAAAHKEGNGEFAGALTEAAKRGVLGLVFKSIHPLKQYLRAPIMGGVFATQTAAEGGDAREVAKGFGTGMIYSMMSPGGKYGLTEVRENIAKDYIRKIAAEPKVEQPIVERDIIKEKAEIPDLIERTPDGRFTLEIMRDQLKSGEAGMLLDEGGGITGRFSSHAPWFREVAKKHKVSAAEATNIINKVIDGKSLTDRQNKIWYDIEKAAGKERYENPLVKQYAEELNKQYGQLTKPEREAIFEDIGKANRAIRDTIDQSGLHPDRLTESRPDIWRVVEATARDVLERKGILNNKQLLDEVTNYCNTWLDSRIAAYSAEWFAKEKATGKGIVEAGKSATTEAGQKTLQLKQSEQSLLAEARKYKTAEEFVEKIYSPMDRIKSAEIDNIFNSLPDGTITPDGYIKKIRGKLYPTEKATPELLKNSGVSLNADGSIKEGFGLNRTSFTEDVFSKSQLTDIWNKAQEGKGDTAAFAPEKDFRRQPEKAEKTDEITRRSDLVRFLNEKLDIPIRTGKFHDKALGIFKIKSEVIRTKQANDIEVISHEVGHALQKFLYPEAITAQGLSTVPFSRFKNELDPLATKPKAGQEVTPEGFAEFVRLYITDPAKAKEKAPRFYNHFEAELKSKTPETLDILREASAHYDRWLKQPALQRVLSQVSIGEKESRSKSLDDVYTAMVDELYPLKKIVETVAKGDKLPISSDPYATARLTRGSDGKAETFLKHSPFKFDTYADVGKSMKDILKPVQNRIDEFIAYSVAKKALALEKKGKESGILKKDAEEVIKQFNKDFAKPYKEMSEYRDNLRKYLEESGIGSKEMHAKLEALADDYVPFFRVMDKDAKGMGVGKGFEAKQPIKRQKGSARDIINPLESDIKNTFAYIHAAEKNAVGLALVKLGESREGMGKFIEKVPRPMKEIKLTKEEKARLGLEDVPDEIVSIFRPSDTYGENIISVWNKGKQEFYEVHPDIARVFKALDKEQSNILMRVLSKPASWLRAGATLTPEFIGRNPLRDQLTAFIYSKYGVLPLVDLTSGIYSMTKKDAYYWNAKKAGMDHSMLVSMDRDYLQDNLGELLSKYPVANRIKNPMEALRILSELGEQGTRIGEFKKGVKKEGATKEGMQKAALAAREVTLDFNKKGTIGKSVNMITAFWNAQIQGMDKMVREFKENPGRTTLRTALAITLPSVLLAIGTHDDERIKELPAWQRDLFWCVPVGDTIYRIPKPFELGVLFGSFPERITHWILDQDPHAFDGLLKSIKDAATPGFVPTAAIPILENWANKSVFFDRPIVPPSRTDVLPEYQYGPHTTETAKALGKLFGRLPFVDEIVPASPAYIENLIRGWSGGLGQHALDIMDWSLTQAGLSSIDYEKPSFTLSDIPLIKAFIVRYPSANTASVTRFYDNYNKAQQTLNTVNALLMKEGKPDEALRLMESSPMDDLSGFYSTIRDQHKLIDAIYSNPMMTGDEKREYIDMLYIQMIGIAQRGNEIIDSMEKQRKEMKGDNISRR